MTQLKGPLLILFVITASFVWGYQSKAPKKVTSQAESPPEIEQVQAKDSGPATTATSPLDLGANNAVNPGSPAGGFYAQGVRQPLPGQGPRPAENLSADSEQNPYRQFMLGANRAANLDNTLDSINPGQQEGPIRRNAYFEKLSQQLKELRGEPPPPSDQPPNDLAGGETAREAPIGATGDQVTHLPPARPAPFADPINSNLQASADGAQVGESFRDGSESGVLVDQSGQVFPIPPATRQGPEIVREAFIDSQLDEASGADAGFDDGGGGPPPDDVLVDEIVDYLAQ